MFKDILMKRSHVCVTAGGPTAWKAWSLKATHSRQRLAYTLSDNTV